MKKDQAGTCPKCGILCVGNYIGDGDFYPAKHHVCVKPEQNANLPEISLRDWFAGLAMQGILVENSEGAGTATFNWGQRAQAAYKAADAMLKAREVEYDNAND